jgi:hypothetical protein
MRDPDKIPSQAALCNGDSGGSGFQTLGKSRVSMGINSISDNRVESWIADLSRIQIQQFLVQQSQRPELHICGIHPDARHCRPVPIVK